VTPAELRRLVPAATERTYLNTATYGPASRPVVAAIQDFTDRWSRGVAEYLEWEAAAEDCRRLFAKLVDAAVEDVAIQPYVSATAGAIAVQLRPGERVVVDDLEYTSNLWPWLYQRDRGVDVTVIPAREGRVDLEVWLEAIGERVAITAVSAMQSSNGYRAPLARLAAATHAAGGLLFVDACQGAGGIRLNPVEDGFDFLAADSYKWMMGPRGMGYLYLSKAAQERFRPVTMGWRSGRHPQESYYGVDMDLSPSASRFDSSLSWIAVVGDRESLGLLTTIGAGRIEAHNLALAARFRAGLTRLGQETDPFRPEEHSPIVAVHLPDGDAVVQRLKQAGVIASRRATGVRFSFHVFNDESDVDRALSALA